MPLYEYRSPAGHVVMEHRPVEKRDAPLVLEGVVFERVRVPKRLMVCTGAQPETMSSKLTKGYYRLEERGQLADRPGYMSKQTLRAALAAPESP